MRFDSRHSTSSISTRDLASACVPILNAAANSATGIRVRRIGGWPSLDSSKPPAMKTFRNKLRNAMSRPRSRGKYMRRFTKSSSPADIALSKPLRSPFIIQLQSGRNNFSSLGNGARSFLLGKVCVVTRWQGIKYARINLQSVSCNYQAGRCQLTLYSLLRLCDTCSMHTPDALQPVRTQESVSKANKIRGVTYFGIIFVKKVNHPNIVFECNYMRFGEGLHIWKIR
jgi:hypothetical protein